MKLIIRADSSIQIGSGHIMRCLTVAKQLITYGFQIIFWMEPLEGNLIDYVKKQGFLVDTKLVHGDLLIIDHYGLNKTWEQEMRNYFKKIIVIDDLAREHDCDLLLDQNMVTNFGTRYDQKVPNHCKKLLGINYLILRDEFIIERKKLKKRTNNIDRLLVFLGGTDPTNETLKVLRALEDFDFPIVDIVVGKENPNRKKIETICFEKKYQYHCQINYMASLMRQADFSIGAGGSTVWERVYLGLPSSATIVANNQYIATEYVTELGLINNLGWHENVTVQTYRELLSNLDIKNMSEKCLEFTKNIQSNLLVNEILEMMK